MDGPVFPARSIEEAILSLVYVLGTFVKDEITVDVWTCFWAPESVPLFHASVFMLVPCCLGYYGSVVLFEVR